MFQSGIQDLLLDRVLRLKTLFGFGQLIYFFGWAVDSAQRLFATR